MNELRESNKAIGWASWACDRLLCTIAINLFAVGALVTYQHGGNWVANRPTEKIAIKLDDDMSRQALEDTCAETARRLGQSERFCHNRG